MNREDVVKMLADSNITVTPQRVDVAEVLFARPQHVSAEQIIDELKLSNKSVSKATVYNTLNRFVSKGIAKVVTVNPERAFYDSVTTMHHHFYNEDTGEIIDIPLHEVVVEKMPDVPLGTQLKDVEVVIHVRNR